MNKFMQAFTQICLYYEIDPAIALENSDVREAIRNKDIIEIERILRDEF